jgi:uncharacterized protein (DUF1697 family)
MKPQQTLIALLRGINVGGKNKLPMKDLVAILQELGCSEIKTYIQSGNAVFRTPVEQPANLAKRIGEAIKQRFGFHPQVLLLTRREIEAALASNPFTDACSEGNTLHLYFLAETATAPDLQKLAALQNGSERFDLHDRVFYLHAPDGIGRSKLAANVEKLLGVTVTARNGNTVCKILDLTEHAG